MRPIPKGCRVKQWRKMVRKVKQGGTKSDGWWSEKSEKPQWRDTSLCVWYLLLTHKSSFDRCGYNITRISHARLHIIQRTRYTSILPSVPRFVLPSLPCGDENVIVYQQSIHVHLLELQTCVLLPHLKGLPDDILLITVWNQQQHNM